MASPFHVAPDFTFSAPVDQDYVPAQLKLGLCYEKGIGVPQDAVQAVGWFRKAAEAGEPYRKAADQGDAPGQLALGRCYETGIGVVADRDEAIRWYEAAAKNGNTQAQEALARLNGGLIDPP